jgi:hypothetical protein
LHTCWTLKAGVTYGVLPSVVRFPQISFSNNMFSTSSNAKPSETNVIKSHKCKSGSYMYSYSKPGDRG